MPLFRRENKPAAPANDYVRRYVSRPVGTAEMLYELMNPLFERVFGFQSWSEYLGNEGNSVSSTEMRKLYSTFERSFDDLVNALLPIERFGLPATESVLRAVQITTDHLLFDALGYYKNSAVADIATAIDGDRRKANDAIRLREAHRQDMENSLIQCARALRELHRALPDQFSMLRLSKVSKDKLGIPDLN